ncbi:MAG: hypothetical protein CMK59_13800 [Proteobacteria bacterium]|nr:hypothetical protein [Pseudomonadota bacterium]
MRNLFPVILLFACNAPDVKIAQFNTPPTVTILAPVDGEDFVLGETVTFEALVDDQQDEPTLLTLRWSSDIDGELVGSSIADGEGKAQYATANLSEGEHTISLLVVDTEGESELTSVNISVEQVPEVPTIKIRSPEEGEIAREGEAVAFEVEFYDSKDDPLTLAVSFDSSIDGDAFCFPSLSEESQSDGDVVGIAQCQSVLSTGSHFLTFLVVDSDDMGAQATMYLDVLNELDIDDDGDGETENEGDCDDQNPTINTDGNEIADNIDNNCDGNIDEGDDDYDGFSELQGDCNDANTGIHPGATEIANGIDDDCDGIIDEDTSGGDDDGDGYSESAGDCNDNDSSISPDEDEVCDSYGIDENCDGLMDELNADGCTVYLLDADGDGHPEEGGSSVCMCEPGGLSQYAQYTVPETTILPGQQLDCHDGNSDVHPAQTDSFATPYTTIYNQSSFDYDCNGVEEKDLDQLGECMCDANVDPDNEDECDYIILSNLYDQGDCGLKNDQVGWLGSIPACGGTGQLLVDTSDCVVDLLLGIASGGEYFCAPNPNLQSYYQGCK